MLAVDGTKVCSNPECLAGGEPQAIENFNRDGSKTDGLSNWCRICRNRSHKGTIEKSFFIRGHEIKNRQKYNWWHLFHRQKTWLVCTKSRMGDALLAVNL